MLIRILSYIFILPLALVFSACSDLSSDIYPDTSAQRFGIIQGTVTDSDNNLLEHIRITLRANDRNEAKTYYTTSEGKFRCEIPIEMKESWIILNIQIEDIDGEQNGGFFETRSDMITIFEDAQMSDPIIINLPTYRLTHATASANSPQF